MIVDFQDENTYSSFEGLQSVDFVCNVRGSADDNRNKLFHSSLHSCSENTRPYLTEETCDSTNFFSTFFSSYFFILYWLCPTPPSIERTIRFRGDQCFIQCFTHWQWMIMKTPHSYQKCMTTANKLIRVKETFSSPSDVACNKQFPSPVVTNGYSFGQGSFLLTHQFNRSKR